MGDNVDYRKCYQEKEAKERNQYWFLLLAAGVGGSFGSALAYGSLIAMAEGAIEAVTAGASLTIASTTSVVTVLSVDISLVVGAIIGVLLAVAIAAVVIHVSQQSFKRKEAHSISGVFTKTEEAKAAVSAKKLKELIELRNEKYPGQEGSLSKEQKNALHKEYDRRQQPDYVSEQEQLDLGSHGFAGCY